MPISSIISSSSSDGSAPSKPILYNPLCSGIAQSYPLTLTGIATGSRLVWTFDFPAISPARTDYYYVGFSNRDLSHYTPSDMIGLLYYEGWRGTVANSGFTTPICPLTTLNPVRNVSVSGPFRPVFETLYNNSLIKVNYDYNKTSRLCPPDDNERLLTGSVHTTANIKQMNNIYGYGFTYSQLSGNLYGFYSIGNSNGSSPLIAALLNNVFLQTTGHNVMIEGAWMSNSASGTPQVNLALYSKNYPTHTFTNLTGYALIFY